MSQFDGRKESLLQRKEEVELANTSEDCLKSSLVWEQLPTFFPDLCHRLQETFVGFIAMVGMSDISIEIFSIISHLESPDFVLACPGSFPAVSLCPGNITGLASRGHTNQMRKPPRLAPLGA